MGKVMPGKCQWMATNRIKTRAPFNSLFPVDEKTVEAVAEHMRINGYDQSQPLVLWKEKLDEDRKQAIVIDGHTRLLAAKKIGLSPVYVARVSFASADAALEYAIHNQRDRRNLTDADLLRCIEAVDERKPRGGDHKSEAVKSKTSSEAIDSGKSAEQTALIVGTSKTKVEKARTLLDYADEQTKQTVLDGKQSIHAAAKETQEKRKARDSGILPVPEVVQIYEKLEGLRRFLDEKTSVDMHMSFGDPPGYCDTEEARAAWKGSELLRLLCLFSPLSEYLKNHIPPDPQTIIPGAPELTTKDFQKKVIESDVPALVYFTFSDYEHYQANKKEYSEAQSKKGELCST